MFWFLPMRQRKHWFREPKVVFYFNLNNGRFLQMISQAFNDLSSTSSTT